MDFLACRVALYVVANTMETDYSQDLQIVIHPPSNAMLIHRIRLIILRIQWHPHLLTRVTNNVA